MRTAIVLLIFILLLSACKKDSSKTDILNTDTNNISGKIVNTDDKSVNQNSITNKLNIMPEKNPRLALEQLGFWNKQYFRLEYNPLYGYCYQHLFPAMDTSQEKDVIAFHIKTLQYDPIAIFIVDKIIYKNGAFELSGKINNQEYTVYIRVQDGKTINITLDELDINESYDISSGIAYSSFTDIFNQQDRPSFDLSSYDTCEEQDVAIISDISDKLTDTSVKEQYGINVKTEKGLDCWGKWANISDKNHIYYELDKDSSQFIDYSEQIFSNGIIRKNTIENMVYKNGIFYFNFEDNEMIGHMCIPIDNNTSMWVLDDINLGIYIKK